MITKISASGNKPEVEDIEAPPQKLTGPALLREQLLANPEMNTAFHFNDKVMTVADLVDEIIELYQYNDRAQAMIRRMGDPYAMDAEVDSSGTNIEVRSKLTIMLAEQLGSYLRGDGVKNFVTMELTSPDPKVGRFEVTVRRANGETPAEQLGRLRKELDESEELSKRLLLLLNANGISVRDV